MHRAEDKHADEEPVPKLEQAVPAAPDVVGRGDPHRDGTQRRHPPHRRIDASVGVRVNVDRLVPRVSPSIEPDPVDDEQEGVHADGPDGEVTRDDVVEHRALEGDAEGGPDLAVAGDRDEDHGEVGGGHQAHEDRDHSEPEGDSERYNN